MNYPGQQHFFVGLTISLAITLLLFASIIPDSRSFTQEGTQTSGKENAPFDEGSFNLIFVNKWGSFGHGEGQFDHSTGVAIDPDSKSVYVADINNDRVQKFSLDGKFISVLGPSTGTKLKLSHPADISIGPNGSVYVSDILNNRIVLFDSEGKYVSSFGSGGKDPAHFDHPGNIAIDADGQTIYVVDVGNNRVQKFSLEGRYLANWGTEGTADGQFNRPAGIAINNNERKIYVADTKNNRIQVFSADGNFISKWGATGTGKGQFSRPTDIAVDDKNNLVYVTDNENSRIQVFNKDGSFVSTWGSKGTGDGQFMEPTGISIDTDQNAIYVADKPGNRISVFRISNTSEQVSGETMSRNMQQYSNPTIGISLSYPPDWKLIKSSEVNKEVVFRIQASSPAKLGATLSVKAVGTLSENSLDDYVSTRVQSLQKDPRTLGIDAKGSYSISGHPASRIVYTTQREGITFFLVQFLTSDGSEVYSITFASPSEGHLEYLKSALPLIQTITLGQSLFK